MRCAKLPSPLAVERAYQQYASRWHDFVLRAAGAVEGIASGDATSAKRGEIDKMVEEIDKMVDKVMQGVKTEKEDESGVKDRLETYMSKIKGEEKAAEEKAAKLPAILEFTSEGYCAYIRRAFDKKNDEKDSALKVGFLWLVLEFGNKDKDIQNALRARTDETKVDFKARVQELNDDEYNKLFKKRADGTELWRWVMGARFLAQTDINALSLQGLQDSPTNTKTKKGCSVM